MVQSVTPVSTVTIGARTTPTISGGLTIDEAWSPYGSGTITVPIDGLDIADLDPRTTQRVRVDVSDASFPDDVRSFDLGLRGRTIDHKARTIDLDVATDEALLFDTKRLAATVDSSARAYQASVRGICNWALGKVGAALLPGAWDADMTAQWDATNLLLNPGASGSAAEWTAGSNTTITWDDRAGQDGKSGWIAVIPTTSAAARIYATSLPAGIPCRPGELHTGSIWVRPTNAGQAITRIAYYDAAGRFITEVGAPALNVSALIWARPYVTAVAPANAASMTVYVVVSGGSFRADNAMLTEGPLLMPYFDGSTASTPNYTYSWEDAADASASLRVATPERLPELFDWQPGQSLWDFLRPFTEAAGLRLFCDENRDWRLIDPTAYDRPDVSVLARATTGEAPGEDGNTTAGTDDISRDRDDWATGVIVRFQWRDQAGRNREDYDVAGTPGKVVTFDRDTPPLKGAAATILARLRSRGASQTVTIIGGLDAAPAGFVNVDLGTVPSQSGRVSRARFDLATGLTEITTRDMQEDPV